jgi:hypothetical protein
MSREETIMKSLRIFILLPLFLAGSLQALPAAAQETPPALDSDVPKPGMKEKLEDYRERLGKYFEEKFQAKLEQDKKDAPGEVAQKPTAVAPPTVGFSDRVLDTVSDFLPYFQFAINSVTANDDHTAVTAKFNPFDNEFGAWALSATAAEPKLYSPLEQAIEESARDSQSKALLGTVDDFSDVTVGLTYGFQRPAGTFASTRKMFGRNTALYNGLIDEIINSPDPTLEDLHRRFAKTEDALAPVRIKLEPFAPNRDPSQMTIQEIKDHLTPEEYDRFLSQVVPSSQLLSEVSTTLQSYGLDALSSFISNQPQATLTLSNQIRKEVLGPDVLSGTVSYEMGTRNFNRVLREYHRTKNSNSALSPLAAFAKVAADPRFSNEDKLTFKYTYSWTDEYSFTHPYQVVAVDPGTGQETNFDHTASVHSPRVTENHWNVLWTRLMPKLPFAAKVLPEGDAPRFSLSIESVDINGDPTRQSHVTGKLGFVFPMADSMSLPITLTYSDRPELLTGQDHVFGAHLGLTYKMNRDKPAAGQQ